MSIDRTQPLQPVTQVQSRENTESAIQPRKARSEVKTDAQGTQVSLSAAQSSLMKPGSQDIDMKRVGELKTAIRTGQLTMDTGKIADALLRDTQDFLKGN
jgi:negative regulator of flagellin synthesis FlgM